MVVSKPVRGEDAERGLTTPHRLKQTYKTESARYHNLKLAIDNRKFFTLIYRCVIVFFMVGKPVRVSYALAGMILYMSTPSNTCISVHNLLLSNLRDLIILLVH